jgi:exodeoxyribonuclease VII large subunit
MTQQSLFSPEPPPALSVTDLTRRIRQLLETDPALQQVWVIGEVSNLSTPASGHLYFTLKDAGAALRCVMWKSNAARLRFLPRSGDAVEVHGSISVYEVGGQYQLYADQIRPAGEGALYQEFLRLKARLESEGLFDEARKRPIPRWPTTIGIVTSPTGAALRDMLDTLRRRFPLARVVLAPTAVQGLQAPAGIVAALQGLNTVVEPDIILLARGGGSIEDLWAFNDEDVVRMVASSTAPVITGVGHETDFTLSDFAADLRAPTPTAAAELAVPDRADLRQGLSDRVRQLVHRFEVLLKDEHWHLAAMQGRLQQQSPQAMVRRDRQRLDELAHRSGQALVGMMRVRRAKLKGDQQRLQALNPLSILKRGFSVVEQQDGTVVRKVGQVAPGDPIRIHVQDGAFRAEVREEEERS